MKKLMVILCVLLYSCTKTQDTKIVDHRDKDTWDVSCRCDVYYVWKLYNEDYSQITKKWDYTYLKRRGKFCTAYDSNWVWPYRSKDPYKLSIIYSRIDD